MAEAVLQEVENCIFHRHNTAPKFSVTGNIMELCLTAEQMPGLRLDKRWWDKDGLYLEGM